MDYSHLTLGAALAHISGVHVARNVPSVAVVAKPQAALAFAPHPLHHSVEVLVEHMLESSKQRNRLGGVRPVDINPADDVTTGRDRHCRHLPLSIGPQPTFVRTKTGFDQAGVLPWGLSAMRWHNAHELAVFGTNGRSRLSARSQGPFKLLGDRRS